jgi:hypothetical protein
LDNSNRPDRKLHRKSDLEGRKRITPLPLQDYANAKHGNQGCNEPRAIYETVCGSYALYWDPPSCMGKSN